MGKKLISIIYITIIIITGHLLRNLNIQLACLFIAYKHLNNTFYVYNTIQNIELINSYKFLLNIYK